MGVYESSAKIRKSMKDMNTLWAQTKVVWKDEKSRQFENEFMVRFAAEVRKAERSLDNINPLLNRIRSELRR